MAGTLVATSILHKGSGVKKIRAVLTADAAGNVTAAVAGTVFGRLVGVAYKPGTFATGVNITVTDSDSGATVFSLAAAGLTARFIRPTSIVVGNTGVVITAAATATNVDRDIIMCGKVKIAVSAAGVSTAGELDLIVDESIGGGL